jgi:hypothetical protein
LATVSPRKFGLFGCGCCRVLWHLLLGEMSRRAVHITEQFLDGDSDLPEWDTARVAAHAARDAIKARLWDAGRESARARRAAAQAVVNTSWLAVEAGVEESATAVGLVIDHLPEGCGPAVPGTADDLQ